MIKSFRDRDTEALFNDRSVRRWAAIERQATRRLYLLHRAKSLLDLAALPSNNLHPLRHERAGQHAIAINEQWRICFKWKEGDAYDVEIVDYH